MTITASASVSSRGSRRLLDKYGFRIHSDLLKQDVGFTTCSELKVSSEVITYRAGGSLIPVKSPGLASYDPFTASRGATTGIHDLREWKLLVVDGSMVGGPLSSAGRPMGTGSPEAYFYKKSINVVHLNRMQQPIVTWHMENAWPSEFTGMDGLDNNTSEHVFESMTWEYDFFEQLRGTDGSKFSVSVRGSAGVSALGVNVGINFAALF